MKKVVMLISFIFALFCSCAVAESRLDARIKEIYTAHNRTFFLTEDGTLFITGSDASNSDISGSSVPYFIDSSVEKMCVDYSLSYQFLYMKTDGTVWSRRLRYSFGYNSWNTEPVFIIDGAKDIYLWGDNYYIIRHDGSLWTMGQYNSTGMLGNGTTKPSSSPGKVMENVKKVYSYSGGYVHVLTEDGKLYGIGGDKDFYVLGDGTKKCRTTPVLIMENVKEVYNGIRGTFALTNNGELYAWGVNGKMTSQGITYWHYLGNGGSSHIKKPERILDNVRLFVCDPTRSEAYYAVTKDEKLWTWGGHHVKEIAITGNGKYGAVKLPEVIMQPECGIRELGADYVILNDNTLWVWSSATGVSGPYLAPTCVAENVKAYYGSDRYVFNTHLRSGSYYLDMDNRLWSWHKSSVVIGADYAINVEAVAEPIIVMENVEKYSTHSQCFVRTLDGKLWAWGDPNGLGNGLPLVATGLSYKERATASQYQWPPVEICLEAYYPEWLVAELTGQTDKGTQRIKQVIVGSNNYVLMEDGDLWGWGINSGYLGMQNIAPIALPAVIMDGVEWISTGSNSSSPIFVLKKNGDVICWSGRDSEEGLEAITPKVVAQNVHFDSIYSADWQLLYVDDVNTVWAIYSNGKRERLMENVMSLSNDHSGAYYFITMDQKLWQYVRYTQKTICLSERTWKQVVHGYNAVYALDTEGNLFTYGYINQERGVPVDELTFLMSGVRELHELEADDETNVFATMVDGTFWSLVDSWDQDSNGDYCWGSRLNPRQLAADISKCWTSESHLYMLTSTGTLLEYKWVQESDVTTSSPREILSDVVMMSVANNWYETRMALTNDGGIWLWGEGIYNEAYQAYRDDKYNFDLPVRINECPGATAIFASSSENYFVLSETGTLLTVGNRASDMGVYDVPADIFTFVPVQLNNGKKNTQPITSTPLANTTVNFGVEASQTDAMNSTSTPQPASEKVYKTLKKGSSGNDVIEMKQRLQELGYFVAGASMSNSYNATTVERVKLFQKVNGLSQTGVADNTTLQLLYSNNAKPNPNPM